MRTLKIQNVLAGLAICIGSLIAVPMLTANQIYLNPVENDFIEQIKDKIKAYYNAFPEERMYLQTDKTLYKPGENVWLSSYLIDGKSLMPSKLSEIVHVELIAPSGNVFKKFDLISKNGRSTGSIKLEKSTLGGQYILKAYTDWQKNEKDTLFFSKKITVQKVILPKIKMKLDFQRESFGPGDVCIAKIELENNSNEVLSNHTFEYLVKIKNKEYLRETAKTGNDGSMYLEFKLPKNLKTNDVLLSALIPHKNQTESISRSVPVVLNDIQLEFFPEGGDLVYNLPSHVAFRAFNESGKPVDVEGVLYNSDGEELANIKSFQFGMGAFAFTPASNDDYYVQITKPVSLKDKFILPEVLPAGYVLNIQNNKKELAISIQSSISDLLHLVMQSRGKVIYTSEINVAPGANHFNIATEKLPIGVAQLTVFDNYGIERAERLVFLNQEKQLNISIQTDKEKYTPREKVKLTIKATDKRGIPVPTTIGLSVVNDQLLSFADDKSGTIVSQLLLEQDLDKPVHEPAFYFDKDEPKAFKALDYLLMTSGWRRFTWKEINDEEIPVITFKAQKAFISGTVLNSRKQIVENASVTVVQDKVSVKTDENGRFTLKGIELYEVKTLAISANGLPNRQFTINEYKEDYEFVMNPHLRPMAIEVMDAVEIAEMAVAGNIRKKAVRAELAVPPAPVEDELEEIANEDLVEMVEDMLVEEKALGANKNPIQVFQLKDERFMADKEIVFNHDLDNKRPAKKVLYKRSREFSAPVYETENNSIKREDFRSTIYWNGNIELDRTGTSRIEFYTSDEITSFKAIAEGISSTGEIGRAETVIYNQLPVSISVKTPNQVITSDKCYIPVTFTNNKEENITGGLDFVHPMGCKLISALPKSIQLKAGQSKTIYVKYDVVKKNDSALFAVKFKGPGFEDEIVKTFDIISEGFPAQISYSAQDINGVYSIHLDNVVKGSVSAQLTAYPSVVSDLLSGVESILREPSGCFEQTSMSSYPNILVMDYLKTTENEDKKLMAKASNLLDKGYNKLITFETSKKGYDWFGRAPANEALTAYGLMQFNDMKQVSNPDQGMIDRTADWLLKRRDGNGGFLKHNSAADSYGRASEEITNAYIVYALTEAGYKEIEKERQKAYQEALKSDDAYQLAMMANVMFERDDKNKASKLMSALLAHQKEDGSFTGATHSITRSTGISLSIETTSIALMAMLKDNLQYRAEINKSVDWLIKQRSGHGSFGNTQGTILALKALTQYAKQSKKIADSGTIEVLVDGVVVQTKKYEAGSRDAILMDGLEKYLVSKNNRVRIRFKETENALPYSLMVNWNTYLPNSAKESSVKLDVNLASSKVISGENIRLNAKISNQTNKGLASPLAIIGIPAGLSLQAWQLAEMKEKGMFDYYEIVDNNIIIYLRQLAPNESKEYSFDLKADIPGNYKAAASCAYLYYTNEFKHWTSTKSVFVETAMK